MLRRTLVKFTAAFALAASISTAHAYTAGEHYLVLDKPEASAAGTLTKVWTIGCPFCYRYEKLVDPTLSREVQETAGLRFVPLLLETQGEVSRRASEFLIYCRMKDEAAGRRLTDEDSLYRRAGLRFVPLLLETQGEVSRRASEFLIYCRMKDEAAGRRLTDEDSLYRRAEEAWFSAFHDRGARWKKADALLAVAYEATGISPEDFESARQTPALQTMTDSQRWAYEAVKNYGVPAYVVNGKYLVVADKLKGTDDMVALIKELAAKN